MLDMIYINILKVLLTDDVPFSRIPDLFAELKKMIAENANDYSKNVDIQIKYATDEIIKKYGLLGSLTRISELDDKLANIEETKIESHCVLLKVASKILYEKINEYYLTELSKKLNVILSKIVNGTFNEAEFLTYIIKSDSASFPFFMPSIDEIESSSQMVLNGFDVNSDAKKKKRHSRSPSFIQDIYAEILSENEKVLTRNIIMMKKSYKGDLNEYLAFLIDILTLSSHREHHIAAENIMEIGEIAYETRATKKSIRLEPINQTRLIP